jgi:hypothetical protein
MPPGPVQKMKWPSHGGTVAPVKSLNAGQQFLLDLFIARRVLLWRIGEIAEKHET